MSLDALGIGLADVFGGAAAADTAIGSFAADVALPSAIADAGALSAFDTTALGTALSTGIPAGIALPAADSLIGASSLSGVTAPQFFGSAAAGNVVPGTIGAAAGSVVSDIIGAAPGVTGVGSGGSTTPLIFGSGGGVGGGSGFLPATGISDISSLTPSVASSFGIPSDIALPIDSGGVVAGGAGASDVATGGGFASKLKNWLTDPKNLATLGLLGISGVNAFKKQQLPTADTTALNNVNTLNPQAVATVQSGGTASPLWAQQKSAIDANIDAAIQNEVEAAMQAAANSGMGGANSLVVQEKINQIKQNFELQRQQLYMQAQQQNVLEATKLLTGNNEVLSRIAQTQLQQSTDAQNTAMKTAELAMMLQGMTSGIPNKTTTPATP